MSDAAGRCPDCEAPLRRAGYCHACGWDGDLENDGGYLDGVDLPDEVEYEEVLTREGLPQEGTQEGTEQPPPALPAASDGARAAWMVLLLTLGALIALALLGR